MRYSRPMKLNEGICCGTCKCDVNPGGPNLVGGGAMGVILSGAAAAIGCRRKRFGERSMIVGTPKEIKNHEYCVGLTPESARELVAHGHRVLVETGAGEGLGAHDRHYGEAGAEIVPAAPDILASFEMVVKVKAPHPGERARHTSAPILHTSHTLPPAPHPP